MMERQIVYSSAQRHTTTSNYSSTSRDKETSISDLTWVDSTHKISEIVSRSPPILPILIKCAALSSDPYIAAKIQPDDVMKLGRLQTIDIVQATVEFKSATSHHLKDLDEYNGVQLPSFLAIPKATDSIFFEVVRGSVRFSTPLGLHQAFSPKAKKKTAESSSIRFKTVKALSQQLPRFVKVIKTSKQIRQNTKIIDGHVLEIMGVHTPWATKETFVSCRIDQPDGQVCKLDLNWKGTFDTIPDTKRYSIQDLLRVYRLPITVRVRDFTPSEWIPQKTCSQLKAIKTLDLHLTVEKEETMEFAMAISQTPSSSSSSSSSSLSMSSFGACQDPESSKLVILSKNVDVDFVTSSDMTMNPAGYAEAMNGMGNIGDSMVSMVSKDIYLNEYGSPMMAQVPLSKLQPRLYGTPVRATWRRNMHDECDGTNSEDYRRSSCHHYIDLDDLSAEGEAREHDATSEYMAEDVNSEDPYESLSDILKKAEQEASESQGEGGIAEEYNQSAEDEGCADYTILRSFQTPITPTFSQPPELWRPRQVLTDDTSYYQVPKNPKQNENNDIYIIEDTRGHQLQLEHDKPPPAGYVQGKRTLNMLTAGRCPDTIPSHPPPPIPDRSDVPSCRTQERVEPTSSQIASNSSRSRTLGPATNVYNTGDEVSSGSSLTLGLKPRVSLFAGHNGIAQSCMSSLISEMVTRQKSVKKKPVNKGAQGASQIIKEISGEQENEVTPVPLPPPHGYDDEIFPPPPLPPLPQPTDLAELPAPPPEEPMRDLEELPIADFPPPIPSRSSSLASLTSINLNASMTSESLTSASSLTSLNMATSMTSIDTSPSSPSSAAPSAFTSDHRCFHDNLKTLKPTCVNISTLPHQRPRPLGKSQTKGSINRSQSCSPTHLRNIKAATRKLPDLPIPEHQSEVPPIPEEQSRKPRPSSSGNLLDDVRETPPLPPNRALSVENLLRHKEGSKSSKRATTFATLSRPSPSKPKQAVKIRAKKTYVPSTLSDKKLTPTGSIPVAPIAPRPSPLEGMMQSLTQSRDFAHRRPADYFGMSVGTFPKEEHEEMEEDDDDDYLHPEVEQMTPARYDKQQKYVHSPIDRNLTVPTPPTVPTRVIKKSTSLPRSSIKSLKDIPDDVAGLSCDQVAQAMSLLNIRGDIIENLKREKMNGELLKSMTEEILQTEFQMSQFYAIKVIKFVNGWRP